MISHYDKYGRAAERGPIPFFLAILIPTLVIVAIGWAAFGTLGFVGGAVQEVAKVAQQEVGPVALNQKYEWFKNAYARLDSLNAQIESKHYQIQNMVLAYDATPRSEWPEDDRQALRQYEQERQGLIGAYNRLAAEYNAEMSKFHTAFVNTGRLPAGGNGDIPREVAAYLNQ